MAARRAVSKILHRKGAPGLADREGHSAGYPRNVPRNRVFPQSARHQASGRRSLAPGLTSLGDSAPRNGWDEQPERPRTVPQ
jgi:hypothetical protein